MTKLPPRFKYTRQCYFLPAGHYCEVLRAIRENELGACYPERAMSMAERMTARPFLPTVITEDPYIVGLYSREDVFVWDNHYKEWVNPGVQTYGGSISSLTHELFDNQCTIPMQVLSHEAPKKFLAALKARYSNLK